MRTQFEHFAHRTRFAGKSSNASRILGKLSQVIEDEGLAQKVLGLAEQHGITDRVVSTASKHGFNVSGADLGKLAAAATGLAATGKQLLEQLRGTTRSEASDTIVDSDEAATDIAVEEEPIPYDKGLEELREMRINTRF